MGGGYGAVCHLSKGSLEICLSQPTILYKRVTFTFHFFASKWDLKQSKAIFDTTVRTLPFFRFDRLISPVHDLHFRLPLF